MKLDLVEQDSDSDKSREETQKVTRKSYSLKFKLECLDYFNKNGKTNFWRDYRGKVTIKTFHQWRKDETKLRNFASDRVGVDDFRRNRTSRYRVIFPELHNWAESKQNVSRKELKMYGSSLMVRSNLAEKERTSLGHLSFNDMILSKFLKEYGNDFVRKPSYLPPGNENSKFVCDICNFRLATKETLRRHQLVHSTDRFWKCVLCDVRFKHYHGAVSHGWKKHEQKIEPIKIEDNELAQLPENEVSLIAPVDKENCSPDVDFFVGEISTIEPLALQNGNSEMPHLELAQSTPKNRRTYSLSLKIEALDYFSQHGKKAFWKHFRGQFDSKSFSKWKSNEVKLRADFKNSKVQRPVQPDDQLLSIEHEPVITSPSIEIDKPTTPTPPLVNVSEPVLSRSSESCKKLNRPKPGSVKPSNPKQTKSQTKKRPSSPSSKPNTKETNKLPDKAQRNRKPTVKVKKLNHLTLDQRTDIGTFITNNPTMDSSAVISHFVSTWSVRIPKYIIKNVQMEVQRLDEVEIPAPPLAIKYESAESTHYSTLANDTEVKIEVVESETVRRKRPRIDSPLDYLQKRFRNDSISSQSSLSSFPDTCSTTSDRSAGRGRPSKLGMKPKRVPRPSEKFKMLDFTKLSKNDTLSICVKCELKDDLEVCQGVCKRHFHDSCFENVLDKVCMECTLGGHHCFDCGELIFTQAGKRDPNKPELENLAKDVKCSDVTCGKYYHLSCMLKHKYSKYDKKSETWTCPHHECKCCAKQTNVRVKKSRPLLKCTRCPAGYHQDVACLPAGTFLIGGKHIICPDHFLPAPKKSLHQPIHSNNCFVCNDGGELIICDGCPAAYHRHCADDRPDRAGTTDDFMQLALLDEVDDDTSWYCPYCKGDNQIMYTDLLWTKAGIHRWWPSVVIAPDQIPANVFKIKSGPGEFVVRYLGTNDYNWMYRGRCFPYRGKEDDPYMVAIHHKDSGNQKIKQSLKDKQFYEGLLEAETLLAQKLKEVPPTIIPFKSIKVNKPYSSSVPNLVRDNSFSKSIRCSCRANDDHPCGRQSDCENRCLQMECSTDCDAGDKCENQRFKRREYANTEKFKTKWGGQGLKLKERIKKGDFIIEYVGEIIDQAESKRRLLENAVKGITNFYQINLDRDRVIDSGRAGNYSRFINHSCEPNCETQTWEVNGDLRIGIFALKSMEKGVELTFDYKLTQTGDAKTKCHCGATHCAGFIGDPIRRDRDSKKDEASEKVAKRGRAKNKDKKSKKTPRTLSSCT